MNPSPPTLDRVFAGAPRFRPGLFFGSRSVNNKKILRRVNRNNGLTLGEVLYFLFYLLVLGAAIAVVLVALLALLM